MALVREFHEKFGLPIGSGWFDGGERRLREALLSEEHGEYLEAEDRDEFEAIADALGDMVSVIYGTALSYGIDLDAVLAEIHRSNMTKERDPAMQYPAKNIVKGEGYEPPNLRPILERRSPEPEADRCPNCGMLDSERPALPAEGDTGASSAAIEGGDADAEAVRPERPHVTGAEARQGASATEEPMERYGLHVDDDRIGLMPHRTGEWVRYSDAQARIEAERAAHEADIEMANAVIAEWVARAEAAEAKVSHIRHLATWRFISPANKLDRIQAALSTPEAEEGS